MPLLQGHLDSVSPGNAVCSSVWCGLIRVGGVRKRGVVLVEGVGSSQLRANIVFRRVALLGISSLISGVLVGGVLGRVVMRISAVAAGPEMVGRLTENGNRVGEFTVGGTLILIIFVGVFSGIAGGVVVVASDPWLRWLGPLQGVGFGVAALAATGNQGPFESADFMILEPAGLNVAMFLGLHIVFGLSVSGLYWLADRKLPPAEDREQVGYLIITAIGGIGLVLVVALFTIPSFCGCEADYGFLAIVLTMVGSTAIVSASTFLDSMPSWLSRTATVIGYVSLAALLTVGLTRQIAQIQTIL